MLAMKMNDDYFYLFSLYSALLGVHDEHLENSAQEDEAGRMRWCQPNHYQKLLCKVHN